MGAWSVESFGCDEACDLAARLTQRDDLAAMEAALDAVLAAGDDPLRAIPATAAIVAAEAVARLRGRGGRRDAYSADLDAWVQRVRLQPSPELAAKARRALDRVLGEASELRELWEDAGQADAWRAAVEELRERMGD